jgi:hypothetical protein
VQLRVAFTPPPGRKLDDRFGSATTLDVSASPPELLPDGAGAGNDLTRDVRLAAGTGTLHITARAASCDDSACYLARQDWGVPVCVTDAGERSIELVLTD